MTSEAGWADRNAPVDWRPDVFIAWEWLPWLSDCGEGSVGGESAPERTRFAIGDAVRLVAEPPFLTALTPRDRRRYGRLEGEIFEVVALTLPDELAISRRVTRRGRPRLETFFVPMSCLAPLDPAA